MREVVCGFLNSHKVVVDTLTGEATLLDDENGNLSITYISISKPIDHSNDNVCERLTSTWDVKGVIMAKDYFVKFTEDEAQYYRVSDMNNPFFRTQYGFIENND